MSRNKPAVTLRQLIEFRLGRRDLLLTGGFWLATGLPKLTGAQRAAADALTNGIPPSAADTVVVPGGYRADMIIRWGDPLLDPALKLDVDGLAGGSLFSPGAAAAQAATFGANCDGLGLLVLAPDRLAVCINHEFVTPATMFPGWVPARDSTGRGAYLAERPEAVAVMQAAVGVSVFELERRAGRWFPVPGAPLSRRITATTPITFSGPAAGHRWLTGDSATRQASCLGTFGNCAAGMTPWGTYLTAEENVDDFFGRGADASFDATMAAAHRRFGLRRGDSAYRWEYVDSRFDLSKHPAEPFRFGWIVEIDPRNPAAPIYKRTALGRFKHESATSVLDRKGRPVVYMGDDEVFECLYKFVGDAVCDPASPAPDLLDRGTLYVARLQADGSGRWVPLVWGGTPGLTREGGFRDQGDVLMRCREAADRVGATALDRPEDIAVSPVTGRIYLACTMNPDRGGAGSYRGRPAAMATDAASPRPRNRYGHILELAEDGDDFAAETFRWNVFVLAGDPARGQLQTRAPVAGDVGSEDTYFAGQAAATRPSALANPDNLGFDQAGNLWIVTDGVQPSGNNNGCFVCATVGPDRGIVRQFMSGPVGAEVCGCEFSPDGRSLFLTIQHPGSGGSVEAPVSDWPDGRGRPPRSSLIALEPDDPGRRFGS